MVERTYSDDVLLAAYARLRAEGDSEGCERIRERARRQAAGTRTFADRRPQPPAPTNPLLTTPLHELDAMEKSTYFAHRRVLSKKPRERAQFTARIEGREPGTPLPAREQDWEQHKKNLRTVYAANQLTRSKESREADRYRDVARRRRVLAAIKAEAELAAGMGAHHGPDSEPYDVLYLHDPTGKPITDPQHIKQTLAVRAECVRRLKDPRYQGDDAAAERAAMQRILATPAHAFEVKSLLTTSRQHVAMNPRALAAKKRWSEKYGIPMYTAAVDARRSKTKFSGHRLTRK